MISNVYYAEYGCTFDLRSFPFDDQKCAMDFTMESAKASYIQLRPENVSYQGDIMLLEFFIKDIYANDGPLKNGQGKSVVSVHIHFHRELGNMVNTYFQTFLLCLMAYLTLYINLSDFANRFMGALTSLLVLASLLASIEANLPKTSYFKKIDVWFMSYIIFIFVIIVFHICIDYCRGAREEMLRRSTCCGEIKGTVVIAAAPNKISLAPNENEENEVRRTLRDHAKAIASAPDTATHANNVGKIIFPIVLIVFTTFYFVISLI